MEYFQIIISAAAGFLGGVCLSGIIWALFGDIRYRKIMKALRKQSSKGSCLAERATTMHKNKKKHILSELMMDDERELFRQLVSKNMTVLDAAEIIMENRNAIRAAREDQRRATRKFRDIGRRMHWPALAEPWITDEALIEEKTQTSIKDLQAAGRTLTGRHFTATIMDEPGRENESPGVSEPYKGIREMLKRKSDWNPRRYAK
jgi:hypothetical protein